MLIEIKTKKPNSKNPVKSQKKHLILKIKKFIDEINEFMENNKYSSNIDTSFEELFIAGLIK